MNKKTKKRLIFLAAFTAIALIAYQINFSAIVGADAKHFTFFQFLGPIGAQIFSPIFGVAAVLVVELSNFFVKGAALDWLTIVRFFPMVFAAIYFGTKSKKIALIPVMCIGLFWMHPIGGQAWFYPLFWLIPLVGVFWMKKNLFMRSLGTTFTAHAVGSTAFLYAFNLPVETWAALIPIVFLERVMFALGISFSFIVANTLVHKANIKVLNPDPRYVLSRAFVGRIFSPLRL
jgi:hypothetical protein